MVYLAPVHSQLRIGIDVGGSAIKGGVVDLCSGRLTGNRFWVPTPSPSTPEAVAQVIAREAQRILGDRDCDDAIGVAMPGVVQDGVVRADSSLGDAWIGLDAVALLEQNLGGSRVVVVNDADAAGLAEARYGAGADHSGLILILTFGTGIGSALLMDGQLVPNTEFGQLQVDGEVGEHIASASTRTRNSLTWPEWTKMASRFLSAVETVVSPELIIIGGGISDQAEEWLPLLEARAPIVSAGLRNDAGSVGAALALRDTPFDTSRPRRELSQESL